MSEVFFACPRCACQKFYARENGGGMTPFRVNRDLRPVATGGNAADLSGVDVSAIHCTGCSWSKKGSEPPAKG